MSIEISRIPSGSVPIGQPVIFTIVSGQSSGFFASFKWYLTSGGTEYLVSVDNTYTTTFWTTGSTSVRVDVTEYTNSSWIGGNFYGGVFTGAFSGGTFNYGKLNDNENIIQTFPPKKYIEKIKT